MKIPRKALKTINLFTCDENIPVPSCHHHLFWFYNNMTFVLLNALIYSNKDDNIG